MRLKIARLLDAVSEDEEEAGLEEEVLWHVAVVAGEEQGGLGAGHAPAHEVDEVGAVELARLQRGEALGPAALVRRVRERREQRGRAGVREQRAPHRRLQRRVRRADDAAPARDLRDRQCAAPSAEK
jgi:hypothetical protein